MQADFIKNWESIQPLAVLGTAGYNINECGKALGEVSSFPNTLEEFNSFRITCEPFMLLHSSIVFNRELFYSVGEYRDEGYKATEDCDLLSRFSDIGVVLSINQPLLLYRKHLNSWMLMNTIVQFNNIDRIKRNTYRRRNGLEELSYDEFVLQLQQSMTKFEQKERICKQKGKYLYRLGAISLANGCYITGLTNLAFALFYDHQLVLGSISGVIRFKFALFQTSLRKALSMI